MTNKHFVIHLEDSHTKWCNNSCFFLLLGITQRSSRDDQPDSELNRSYVYLSLTLNNPAMCSPLALLLSLSAISSAFWVIPLFFAFNAKCKCAERRHPLCLSKSHGGYRVVSSAFSTSIYFGMLPYIIDTACTAFL